MMDRTDGQRERTIRYTGIGLTFGGGVGVLVGALIGGWALAPAICVGAGVGLLTGAAIDAHQSSSTQ